MIHRVQHMLKRKHVVVKVKESWIACRRGRILRRVGVADISNVLRHPFISFSGYNLGLFSLFFRANAVKRSARVETFLFFSVFFIIFMK